MDTLTGEWRKSFMLHYNFPAFSVGCSSRGPVDEKSVTVRLRSAVLRRSFL